jgi:hypothetical protein
MAPRGIQDIAQIHPQMFDIANVFGKRLFGALFDLPGGNIKARNDACDVTGIRPRVSGDFADDEIDRNITDQTVSQDLGEGPWGVTAAGKKSLAADSNAVAASWWRVFTNCAVKR